MLGHDWVTGCSKITRKPTATAGSCSAAVLPQSAFFVVAKGRPERWSALQQPGLSPIHIAFRAPSKESVDQFHATGLRLGAINNGDPGVRRAPYYCCFLLDADGNNIEAGVYLGD